MNNINYLKIDQSGNLKSTENKDFKKKNTKNDYLLIVKSLNIGYYIIIPILIGVFLGLQIDKNIHTKPIGVLVGITLGTIASFYNLFKMIEK
jgi:F0F1-type ATP synthase assembly protein I